jgi:hypothetical protein
MNFRFRKSFSLLPGLRGTISKKGVSLNFRAGLFSKSWGTRGTSTTIDMPGTAGFFWREERRRRKMTDEERQEASRKFWSGLVYLLLAVQVVFGLLWIYAPQWFSDCSPSGSPLISHLIYSVVLFAGYAVAGRRLRLLRGPLGVILALAAFYVQWKFLGAVISPKLGC